MRVVLDTNILVRANPKVSPQGLARDLLISVVSGSHVLIVAALSGGWGPSLNNSSTGRSGS